jgi:hypothetical protein
MQPRKGIDNFRRQFKNQCGVFNGFYTGMGESTEKGHTAPLSVFVRGINVRLIWLTIYLAILSIRQGT